MSYTPLSYQDWTVTVAAETDYSFTKEFLKLSHITVSHRAASASAFTVETDFTVTGTSGAATVTLGGTFPARAIGDIIRIERATPNTKAGQLVDFTGGSLREEDLDTARLQNLYISQEARDKVEDSLGQHKDGVSWDAETQRIRNLKAPTESDDAARLADVQEVALGSGNLPPAGAENGYMLDTYGNAWRVSSPDQVRTNLALGTAATKDVGSDPADVLDNQTADAAYLQVDNDLSDVTAATARTNLELGTAATQNTGSGNGDIPVLEDVGGSPGFGSLDGTNLDLSANTTVAGGRVDAWAIFGMVAGSAVASSYAAVPLTVIEGSIHNGDNDITVDTAADDFDLVAGTYIVRVMFKVRNNSATTDAAFRWRLVEDPDGTPVVRYTSVQHQIDEGEDGVFLENNITRTCFVSLGATTTLDIQMEEPNGATVSVIDGQVEITKVS